MQLARSALLAGAVLLGTLAAAAEPALSVTSGESLYLTGVSSSGRMLRGSREQGVFVEGRTAACVSCHRHSGFGAMEGLSSIPPITGQFLFQARAKSVDDSDLPFVESYRGNRDPYTEQTLARAIREGIAADGHRLSYLMPHYDLSDAEMAGLIAYLKSLTRRTVPGVTDSTLHFATILTPDADPIKKAAMLEVLRQYFADKNAVSNVVTPRLRSSRQMRFRIVRHWELHVWTLTGAADSWEAQLDARIKAEPVFAVLSGLGGKDWSPVHRFCQREKMPCLFPNVDLPVVADDDFYSLYYSKSVLLDAALIAHGLADIPATGRHRVVQILRSGDVGDAAAAALASATRPGTSIDTVRLSAHGESGDLARALRDVRESDSLVLWLRPADISALPTTGTHASRVYLSGVMGNLEAAPLPAAWRSRTHLAYAVDLPELRRVRLDYPLGWLRQKRIPVIDLPVQADTYLACGLVSETLNRMADSFVRDYLIERIEGMLEHRIITGYYPRLSLAQGQRFASKGGYLVHFTQPHGSNVAADGGWIVP